ncbi:ABC transporter permease [Bacillus sp. SM2101]|uniref:fluoroquinolone export ABC transporter permease subunit n=1 Tax=Bacillus sp. SM2101 TaxID=2805366 RepID=UPI001BDDF691|nr:ABC transporter permease [Bacillus sp. SM2101]
MRLVHAVGMDIRFQMRQGFYYAYALVCLFYVIVFHFLPDAHLEKVSIAIVFSDPSALGFFFIGGIVLLEREQSTLDSLFVTPLRIHEYFISKIMSLTILALMSSTFTMLIFHHDQLNILTFSVAVVLTSIFFTLLGLILAVRVSSVNGYLYLSPLYIIVFFLPLLEYFNIYDTWLMNLLPTRATLLLLDGSLDTITVSQFIYACIIQAVWILVVYVIAYKAFYKFIVLRIGGSK